MEERKRERERGKEGGKVARLLLKGGRPCGGCSLEEEYIYIYLSRRLMQKTGPSPHPATQETNIWIFILFYLSYFRQKNYTKIWNLTHPSAQNEKKYSRITRKIKWEPKQHGKLSKMIKETGHKKELLEKKNNNPEQYEQQTQLRMRKDYEQSTCLSWLSWGRVAAESPGSAAAAPCWRWWWWAGTSWLFSAGWIFSSWIIGEFINIQQEELLHFTTN